MAVERTLVLVKPDAVRRGLCGEITQRLERRGLVLRGAKLVQVDEKLADAHYAEHRGKDFFAGWSPSSPPAQRLPWWSRASRR